MWVLLNKKEEVYARNNTIGLQLGVFKNKDNAIEVKTRLDGIIIKDKDYYRVYYGIFHNKENIDYICKYLDEIGVSYYKKEINVDEVTFLKADVYEKYMVKSKNKLIVNKRIREMYKE